MDVKPDQPEFSPPGLAPGHAAAASAPAALSSKASGESVAAQISQQPTSHAFTSAAFFPSPIFLSSTSGSSTVAGQNSNVAMQSKKGSSVQLLLLCSSIYAIYFLAIYLFSPVAHADNSDAEFYHQLLKIPQATGYQPTRNFAIVIDTEHGNQLVADDDTSLRFNQLWIQQFQPGHQDRHGGAAFGEVFRSFFKQIYRNYRESHAQALAAYPDENGSIKRSSYSSSMDYNIKLSDDEVRFKIQYSY